MIDAKSCISQSVLDLDDELVIDALASINTQPKCVLQYENNFIVCFADHFFFIDKNGRRLFTDVLICWDRCMDTFSILYFLTLIINI